MGVSDTGGRHLRAATGSRRGGLPTPVCSSLVFGAGENSVARTRQMPGAFGSRTLRFKVLKKKMAGPPNWRMHDKKIGKAV